jgi:hypothetical protein
MGHVVEATRRGRRSEKLSAVLGSSARRHRPCEAHFLQAASRISRYSAATLQHLALRLRTQLLCEGEAALPMVIVTTCQKNPRLLERGQVHVWRILEVLPSAYLEVPKSTYRSHLLPSVAQPTQDSKKNVRTISLPSSSSYTASCFAVWRSPQPRTIRHSAQIVERGGARRCLVR